jgi:hypothetical protein
MRSANCGESRQARGKWRRVRARRDLVVRQVIDPAVGAVFEVDVGDLQSETRGSPRVAFARQVAIVSGSRRLWLESQRGRHSIHPRPNHGVACLHGGRGPARRSRARRQARAFGAGGRRPHRCAVLAARQVMKRRTPAGHERQANDALRERHQLRSIAEREIDGVRRPVVVNDAESPLGWLKSRRPSMHGRRGEPMATSDPIYLPRCGEVRRRDKRRRGGGRLRSSSEAVAH